MLILELKELLTVSMSLHVGVSLCADAGVLASRGRSEPRPQLPEMGSALLRLKKPSFRPRNAPPCRELYLQLLLGTPRGPWRRLWTWGKDFVGDVKLQDGKPGLLSVCCCGSSLAAAWGRVTTCSLCMCFIPCGLAGFCSDGT